MMSLQMINELSRRAAVKAARAHRAPLVVEQQDIDDGSLFSVLRGIPNFGDYRPKAWSVVPASELTKPTSWTYDRIGDDEYVFVDSSGFGSAGEPALTQDEFVALVSANPGLGWALVLEGQFQVHVGAFRKNRRAS